MPIVVTCPQCSGRFSAPDNLAGKRVKCPKCASSLQVPTGESSAPVAIVCGGCGKRYAYQPHLAGKTVPCGACGEVIDVPAAGGAAAPAPAPAPAPATAGAGEPFECPDCGRQYGYRAEMVGKEVPCAVCGTRFIAGSSKDPYGFSADESGGLPLSRDDEPARSPAAAGPKPPAGGKKKKKKKKKGGESPFQNPVVLWGSVVGGAVAVILVIVAAFSMFGSDSPAPVASGSPAAGNPAPGAAPSAAPAPAPGGAPGGAPAPAPGGNTRPPANPTPPPPQDVYWKYPREKDPFEGHLSLQGATLTPDAKQLILSANRYDQILPSDQNEISIWDLATGSRQHAWRPKGERVYSMAVSPDGKTLATIVQFVIQEEQYEYALRLSSLPDGQTRFTSPRSPKIRSDLVFSKTGDYVYTVGRRFERFPVAGGAGELLAPESHRVYTYDPVSNLAAFQVAKMVYVCDPSMLMREDVLTAAPVKLAVPGDDIFDLDFTADGKCLTCFVATYNEQNEDFTYNLCVWDVTTQQNTVNVPFPKFDNDRPSSVLVTPDGQHALVGLLAGVWLYNFQTKQGKLVKVQAMPDEFLPSGKCLCVYYREVLFLNPADGSVARRP